MDFRISGLDADRFSHLFGMDDQQLARHGVQRMVADEFPGYPCRVSLEDAQPGETVLLLNYEHLPVDSPYRSRHAIFVREWAREARPGVNEVPEAIASRLLSVRSFDDGGTMLDADVAEGAALKELIAQLFQDESASYLHIHNARRGCYSARVDRAWTTRN